MFLLRTTFLQVVKSLAALPAKFIRVIQMKGELWQTYSAADVFPRHFAPVISTDPKAQPRLKTISKDLASESHGDNELYRLESVFDLDFMRRYLKNNGGWRLRPVSRHDDSYSFNDDFCVIMI